MSKTNETRDLAHPRQTPFVAGHAGGKAAFLQALKSGRFHHAWLLSGPKGIGKATLAYHFARHLLSGGKAPTLEEAKPDNPVFRRVAGGAEGNLRVIERALNEKTGNLRQEIVVDDVRGLHGFFDLTAAAEGWRVAVIDAADEMNRAAANALLKMLEEPPAKCALLLVSHAPGRLPPTIRSRCRELRLTPLPDAEVRQALSRLFPGLTEKETAHLATLSDGAPGFAARLAAFGGIEIHSLVEDLLKEGKEGLTTAEAHELATRLSLKAQEDSYHVFMELLRRAIAAKTTGLSLAGAGKSRLDCWLSLWENVNRLYAGGEGLNLSRKQVMLVVLEELAKARRAGVRAA